VFCTQNQGKYWDLYTEMFSGLEHRPPMALRCVHGSICKAYEAKLPHADNHLDAEPSAPIGPSGAAAATRPSAFSS